MPDLLVVIDLQPAFAHPESPWFTPGLDDIAARLTELLPRFENGTLFTRFVPPETPFGSWIPDLRKVALRPRPGRRLAVADRPPLHHPSHRRRPHLL